MMELLKKDWGDLLYENLTSLYYKMLKRKERKSLEEEKKTFIKDNTVIVTINGKVIYNSSIDGVMNDDLYNALLSYGAEKDMESIKKEKNNHDNKLVYNLNPTITPIVTK